MQREMVAERIAQFISAHFPLARTIGNDDRLLGNGLLDSLGILEVVAFLEHTFQLTLSDEELIPENFQSIATLAAFVQSKLNGAPACHSEA